MRHSLAIRLFPLALFGETSLFRPLRLGPLAIRLLPLALLGETTLLRTLRLGPLAIRLLPLALLGKTTLLRTLRLGPLAIRLLPLALFGETSLLRTLRLGALAIRLFPLALLGQTPLLRPLRLGPLAIRLLPLALLGKTTLLRTLRLGPLAIRLLPLALLGKTLRFDLAQALLLLQLPQLFVGLFALLGLLAQKPCLDRLLTAQRGLSPPFNPPVIGEPCRSRAWVCERRRRLRRGIRQSERRQGPKTGAGKTQAKRKGGPVVPARPASLTTRTSQRCGFPVKPAVAQERGPLAKDKLAAVLSIQRRRHGAA